MKLPTIPDLRTALQWSRANWMWIVAWIVLPTVVVLALMAWQRRKQKAKSNDQPTTDKQEPTTDNQNG